MVLGVVLLLVVLAVILILDNVQLLKGHLAQLGAEIQEAGRVEGGFWWQAARYVSVPLMIPTLLLVSALSFISAARNVSTVTHLATSTRRPLSLLQLDLLDQGGYESAAVVGVLLVVLTTGIALGLRVAIAS